MGINHGKCLKCWKEVCRDEVMSRACLLELCKWFLEGREVWQSSGTALKTQDRKDKPGKWWWSHLTVRMFSAELKITRETVHFILTENVGLTKMWEDGSQEPHRWTNVTEVTIYQRRVAEQSNDWRQYMGVSIRYWHTRKKQSVSWKSPYWPLPKNPRMPKSKVKYKLISFMTTQGKGIDSLFHHGSLLTRLFIYKFWSV